MNSDCTMGTKESQSNHAASSSSELIIWEIEVPEQLVGRLIGKQGNVVNFIQQNSGAQIYISTKRYTEDSQICHIEGTQQQVDKALSLIGRKIEYLDLTNLYAPPVSSLPMTSKPMNITLSSNNNVLKKSENAWKAGMKRESLPTDPESQKTQDLFKKVRGVLNNLTPQNFAQLMKQVADWTIDTEERLRGVIDLVFEKVINEPNFSVAYGKICHCLAALTVPCKEKPNDTVNFHKLLLNRCQKEFQKDKVDDVVFERKQKELDSAASTECDRLLVELQEARMAQRRYIGHIKFLGELMHECVVKLLKSHDQECLEFLCTLLNTIGKGLDYEKAKPRMDQYFNEMEKIVKDEKTLSRIRFMLMDTIELRLHNWVPRNPDQGPKPIKQIHSMEKMEEQEEEKRVQQLLLSKNMCVSPDPSEQRDQSGKKDQRVQGEEAWNTVPMRKKRRAIDPNKIPKISQKLQFIQADAPSSKATLSVPEKPEIKWDQTAQEETMIQEKPDESEPVVLVEPSSSARKTRQRAPSNLREKTSGLTQTEPMVLVGDDFCKECPKIFVSFGLSEDEFKMIEQRKSKEHGGQMYECKEMDMVATLQREDARKNGKIQKQAKMIQELKATITEMNESNHYLPDPGLEVPDPGLEVPDPGPEVPDPGPEVQGPGPEVPDPEVDVSEPGPKVQNPVIVKGARKRRRKGRKAI